MARMLHLTVALLIVAALLPAAALAGGPAATRAALASQMRQAGGGSGAFAVDLDSGRTIFSSRAGTARTPASVEKLYTISTALTLYGVNGHLTTRVLGDVGVDPAGVLIGNLYLRGGGDPNFGELKAAVARRPARARRRPARDHRARDRRRVRLRLAARAAVGGLPDDERGRAAQRPDLQPRPRRARAARTGRSGRRCSPPAPSSARSSAATS